MYLNAAKTAEDPEVLGRLGIAEDWTEPLMSAPFIKLAGQFLRCFHRWLFFGSEKRSFLLRFSPRLSFPEAMFVHANNFEARLTCTRRGISWYPGSATAPCAGGYRLLSSTFATFLGMFLVNPSPFSPTKTVPRRFPPRL